MTDKTTLLAIESSFWEKTQRAPRPKSTDEEISAKYDTKAERIVTETNREKLQNFYEALKRPNYMDPRPFYQRRQRWSAERQSQLIESFLINIPIPPLFVYEIRPNVYEIMDGQQRITAIKAFYSNELILTGLDRWSELNGRTYSKLPERIRSGIDRRSISWITVLHESSESDEDAFAIKQLVFERLNTGGVKLSHQEIRNALFAGPFNELLVSLSKLPVHREAWSLPPYSGYEESSVPNALSDSRFYLEMEDVEVILRFFALRNAENYTKGMRGFLDIYMQKAKGFTETDLNYLGALYENTLEAAHAIFENELFRPYVKTKGKEIWEWGSRRQKAFADAVLVALSEILDKKEKLIQEREFILEQVKQRFRSDARSVFTGQGNTKGDVINRISIMRDVYAAAVSH